MNDLKEGTGLVVQRGKCNFCHKQQTIIYLLGAGLDCRCVYCGANKLAFTAIETYKIASQVRIIDNGKVGQ